jgi:hypothetical protein
MENSITIIIIALVGCWIGEWSKLIQNIAWWTWSKLNWFACAKCWGFWIGMYWTHNVITAILCSALAMVFNKIYMRL